ncbi:hypothetical protein L3X38_041852 [Prunus dulcis]|uniref:Integrase catalytic domain-containing protein n=1 Tax=Prunus dulcis TaxID=3755 RepID=A0AAD4UU29_PRUDU|nr:hypothetical protein L3X38_041852 [Prunus dulcis]
MTSHLPLVRIRTDHGYEFENSQFLKFCEEMGIKHEFSATITPQQNGVVERKKRVLVEMARGESPGLDLGVDLSTFGISVDLSTPNNSVSVDMSTCHYQPQNPNSSFPIDSSRTAGRPDISYSVGVCASFQSDPKESHLFVVKGIIKYVSGTIDFGLWYTYDTSVNLVGYSNVDWTGCSDYKKSASREVFYVGNNLVAWYSKKKKNKEETKLCVIIHC